IDIRILRKIVEQRESFRRNGILIHTGKKVNKSQMMELQKANRKTLRKCCDDFDLISPLKLSEVSGDYFKKCSNQETAKYLALCQRFRRELQSRRFLLTLLAPQNLKPDKEKDMLVLWLRLQHVLKGLNLGLMALRLR